MRRQRLLHLVGGVAFQSLTCVLLALAFYLRYGGDMSTTRDRDVIFCGPDAPDAARTVLAVRALVHDELFVSLSRDLDHALHGDADAARDYVADYRLLTGTLLEAAQHVRPDLISSSGEEVTIIGVGRPADVVVELLEGTSAEAPFSAWRNEFSAEDAVALHLTGRVRGLLGLAALVEPGGLPPVVDDLAAVRFLRRVRHHLNHPDDENPLQRIIDAFALTKTEAGKLFGVTRQGIDGWLTGGAPAERQEKLTALLALVDLLERKLKADRLPGIARRHADAYGGQTMLDLIAEDRHDELLNVVRGSFDWSSSA